LVIRKGVVSAYRIDVVPDQLHIAAGVYEVRRIAELGPRPAVEVVTVEVVGGLPLKDVDVVVRPVVLYGATVTHGGGDVRKERPRVGGNVVEEEVVGVVPLENVKIVRPRRRLCRLRIQHPRGRMP